jgi:hypothetical protein
MAELWQRTPERFLFSSGDTHETYLSLMVDILRHLDRHTAVDRIATVAPRHLLLASPLAGVSPDTLRGEVINRMWSLDAHQGDMLY